MAQFDVYLNPSVTQRNGFPYVVELQSDQLKNFSTRLVLPLVRLQRRPEELPRRLAQVVKVHGESLYLAAHLCAPLPTKLLRTPVASLRSDADALRDALDAVLSGV